MKIGCVWKTPFCKSGHIYVCLCTSCINEIVGIHTIGYCPQGCYNNGTCVSSYVCACSAGWTGFDCKTGLYMLYS